MLETAKRAALKAGEKIISLRQKGLTFKGKKRVGDFTTQADIASETIILDLLREKFPKHNFVSEEKGELNNHSEYTWIIDPIDGTIPFSSGMPSFGISIGLIKGNEPVLGVIYLPVLDYLVWAEKDKGSYINGKKISVGEGKGLLKSVIGFEFGYVGTRNLEIKKLLSPVVDRVRYTPVLGSTVVGLSYVANGTLDAYIHSAHPWDFAAGAVIIKEAGGKVTDYKGKPIDWSKDWIDVLASSGIIHNKILNLINKR